MPLCHWIYSAGDFVFIPGVAPSHWAKPTQDFPRNVVPDFICVKNEQQNRSLCIIRLHRMHEMQTIVINVRSVRLSVSLSVTNAPNDPGSASLCGVISGGECRVWGHQVQPLSNAFGLWFSLGHLARTCVWGLTWTCADLHEPEKTIRENCN